MVGNELLKKLSFNCILQALHAIAMVIAVWGF